MRAHFGQLAQLVEQRIENPRVRGSIPRLATSFSDGSLSGAVFVSAVAVCAVDGVAIPASFRASALRTKGSLTARSEAPGAQGFDGSHDLPANQLLRSHDQRCEPDADALEARTAYAG